MQCLPGPEGFSNAEFSEAMVLVLCMPSPACKERVGEKVGKAVVDKFGDQEPMVEQLTKEPMDYNLSTRARLKKWIKTLRLQQEKEVQ